jgi:hypothetical protein
MIRDRQQLEEFERHLLKTGKLSYKQALAIYESLFKEAVSLGAVGSNNWMEDIEVDIKIARAINGLS